MGRLFRYGNIIKAVQNPYVSAWVNQVIANGGTVTDAEKAAVRIFVESFDITEFDRIYIYGLNNEIAAKTSIVNPTSLMTLSVNSPVFTPNVGFTGNAATMYLNMRYNPSVDGVKYTLASAGYGFVKYSGGSLGVELEMGGSGSYTHWSNAPLYSYINNGFFTGVQDNSNGLKSTVLNGGNLKLYIDGVLTQGGAVTSTALFNGDMFVLGVNSFGGLAYPTSHTVSFVYYASGAVNMADFSSAVIVLRNTLGW